MADFLENEMLQDGVLMLRLARPPVNAVNPQFLQSIDQRLAQIDSDATIKSVILASAFKVYSAGVDLKEAAAFDEAQQRAAVEWLNKAYLRLFCLSKPVIAAVNGAAIAGGLFFVLAADYRIGNQQAKFGLTEVRAGARFPIVALDMARDVLSPQGFRRLLLSGELITAQTAADWGILDEVVAADQVIPRAIETAQRYAGLPPGTFAAIKDQSRRETARRLQQAIEQNSDPLMAGWFNEETAAAMQAHLQAAKAK